SGVFSLTRWCWQIPTGRLRPRGTQDTARPASLTYTWLSHAMASVFHRNSTSLSCNHSAVLQPRPCRNKIGLGSFPFARHYLGNHCYFLLLRLLRCFSSAGLLIICDMSSTCRVAPFGNPRIKSYVLIPVAYRSLSRPSSPLRAKASTVCPYLLSSPHTLLLVYADAFISVESPLISGMLPLRIAHLPFQGKTTSLLL